jgi:hypothetical protein
MQEAKVRQIIPAPGWRIFETTYDYKDSVPELKIFERPVLGWGVASEPQKYCVKTETHWELSDHEGQPSAKEIDGKKSYYSIDEGEAELLVVDRSGFMPRVTWAAWSLLDDENLCNQGVDEDIDPYAYYIADPQTTSEEAKAALLHKHARSQQIIKKNREKLDQLFATWQASPQVKAGE